MKSKLDYYSDMSSDDLTNYLNDLLNLHDVDFLYVRGIDGLNYILLKSETFHYPRMDNILRFFEGCSLDPRIEGRNIVLRFNVSNWSEQDPPVNECEKSDLKVTWNDLDFGPVCPDYPGCILSWDNVESRLEHVWNLSDHDFKCYFNNFMPCDVHVSKFKDNYNNHIIELYCESCVNTLSILCLKDLFKDCELVSISIDDVYDDDFIVFKFNIDSWDEQDWQGKV